MDKWFVFFVRTGMTNILLKIRKGLGDKVFITDRCRAMSAIKKINRHKRRAIIELMWLGDLR